MPIIIRLKEFIIYTFIYLFYTAAFLFFISSSFGQFIYTFLNRKNPAIQDQDYAKLMSDLDSSHIDYLKTKIILDFIDSSVPSNSWMIIFLLLAFIIFIFLILFFTNKNLSRYDTKVFIIMAFGSIASGVSSLVLLINALLIVVYVSIKIFTVIAVPVLDVMLVSMIMGYTILAYFVMNIEKQLSYDFTKKLK